MTAVSFKIGHLLAKTFGEYVDNAHITTNAFGRAQILLHNIIKSKFMDEAEIPLSNTEYIDLE